MEPTIRAAAGHGRAPPAQRPAMAGIALAGWAAVSVMLFQAYRLLETLLRWYPSATLLVPIAAFAACVLASGVTYAAVPAALATLMRGLALACGLYSIALHPSIPAIAHTFNGWSDTILTAAWLAAGLAALLAMRRPAWLLFCGVYMYWIKHAAGYVTGFPYTTLLDVTPLIQLSVYLAMAVLALEYTRRSRSAPRLAEQLRSAGQAPYAAILCMAIAMQAGNYFHSSLAKGALDGGYLDWMLNNENRNIFHVALYNKQLLWGDWTALTAAVSALLQSLGRPFAVGVFLIQLAAVAVFANRRLLLVLFTLYDLMHVGIFVLAGANFWTWFMINLSIIAAVAQLPRNAFDWRTGLAGALAIALSPWYANIAKLGWYDSLAVNTVHFEVVQADGSKQRVPSTAFGFYSYPIAHMSFGLPPGRYLPTATNGGTLSSAILKQSYRCDFAAAQPAVPTEWDGDGIAAYIRGFHRYTLGRTGPDGRWSKRLYPHHFWSAPSLEKAFAAVDMRRVSAYLMVIDSVCLEPETGALRRQVYRNEYRIDL